MGKNNTFSSNIMLILVILALGLMIYIATIARSDGGQCQLSPLTYGAEKATEANGAEFSCTCSLQEPNSPIIIFDRHEVRIEPSVVTNPRQYESLPDNFSLTLSE